MKKIKGIMVIALALALALALATTACDNDPDPDPPSTGGTDPFAGTWEESETGTKIVAANGSFESSMNGKVLSKGTYTYAGNNVTATLTHVNPGRFGQGDDQLYTWADLPQKYKDNPEYNLSQTFPMTVTGNTLSWSGVTFTKQGGGNSGSIAGVWNNEAFRMTIVQNGGAFTYESEYYYENVWVKMEKGSIALNGNNITFTVMGFWFLPVDPSENSYWMENGAIFDSMLEAIHGGNKTYSGTISGTASGSTLSVIISESGTLIKQ